MLKAIIEYRTYVSDKPEAKPFFAVNFLGDSEFIPLMDKLANLIEFEKANKHLMKKQKNELKITDCFEYIEAINKEIEYIKTQRKDKFDKDYIEALKSDKKSYIKEIGDLIQENIALMNDQKYSIHDLIERFHAVLGELDFVVKETENEFDDVKCERIECLQYNTTYLKERIEEMINKLQPRNQKDISLQHRKDKSKFIHLKTDANEYLDKNNGENE